MKEILRTMWEFSTTIMLGVLVLAFIKASYCIYADPTSADGQLPLAMGLTIMMVLAFLDSLLDKLTIRNTRSFMKVVDDKLFTINEGLEKITDYCSRERIDTDDENETHSFTHPTHGDFQGTVSELLEHQNTLLPNQLYSSDKGYDYIMNEIFKVIDGTNRTWYSWSLKDEAS